MQVAALLQSGRTYLNHGEIGDSKLGQGQLASCVLYRSALASDRIVRVAWQHSRRLRI